MSPLFLFSPLLPFNNIKVEEFYEQLETITKLPPRKDILVVLGDWNVKIGPNTYQQWVRYCRLMCVSYNQGQRS